MRTFPNSRKNSFPVTTFVAPGDEVVWSNSQGAEEDAALTKAGKHVEREYFKGVVVEAHADHAIVAYRAKPNRSPPVKYIKRPVGDKIEWEYRDEEWVDPIPDGELVRVDDPRRAYWFAESPSKILARMGMPEINAGKLRDLVDFADIDIGLYDYISSIVGQSPELFDDAVNFILGPLAATLKAKSSDPAKGGTIYGFRDREDVVPLYAVQVMFEAIALGLVPKSVRKELDAFMVGELPAALAAITIDEIDAEAAETIRETHDEILAETDAARKRTKMAYMIFLMQVTIDWRTKELFYSRLTELLEVVLAAADVDIGSMVDRVLADNPAQAAKAKEDPKLIGWVMGQVMKASPTKLDPNEVRAVIVTKLA